MIKTPFLAVDGIIKLYDDNDNFQGIILIERLNKPFGLAIPGGFVDIVLRRMNLASTAHEHLAS